MPDATRPVQTVDKVGQRSIYLYGKARDSTFVSIQDRKARKYQRKRDKDAVQSKGKATGNGSGYLGTDGAGKPSAAKDRPQHLLLLHQQTVRAAIQRKRWESCS